jgi:dolichol kinase
MSQLKSIPRASFLALTAHEAQIRKYAYASLVYLLVLLVIIFPTRLYVSSYALSNHEAFGWAIGYMLSGIHVTRVIVSMLNLADWVPLPPLTSSDPESELFICHRLHALQLEPANLRLFLCGYCLLVLLVGVTSVLSMASYIEVDTRRKGFHGVMVFMLLPTVFFDPCFFSLALSLILAAFLLLDLFRASQLPPVSRPLTNFLAPYVDGRDHRGPVIVSHVFLLIGCAIPLWLSLSGLQRIGSYPWEGWDVPERNLSMISGVVCVGMGDAAASLTGRRYGKTKWYWGGGKSLEGSVAFTIAVVVGLMFGHSWLRVWGWETWEGYHFTTTVTKCIIAGGGASLLESVLTAANDNVVVPVGLWLLVRALKI